jgi:transcriptional regulator with XRE-family HTH domain
VSIGERILAVAKKKGYKQRDIARAAGVSPSAVSDWIHKGASPTGDKLAPLAEFLGVSIGYLVTGIDSENRDYQVVREQRLTNHELELLRIYNSICVRNQIRLMGFAYELEGEADSFNVNKNG